MKLETIYKEYIEIIDSNYEHMKVVKLKEKLEQAIREETCYKTTSKTRINAIKRVASTSDIRPVLTGYSKQHGYEVVTDSYHLIFIHQEDMPLKLATTDSTLADKYRHENCINGNYPDMKHILDEPETKQHDKKVLTKKDLDDILAYYKMNHTNKERQLYTINNRYYNINYLKNIIDVLYNKDTTLTLLIPEQDTAPLFILNDNDEGGLVLPVKKY